jgi:hypothetical protein
VDLKGPGLDGVDWIDMVQDGEKWLAVVSTVMYIRVAQNAGNLTRYGTISFPIKTAVH